MFKLIVFSMSVLILFSGCESTNSVNSASTLVTPSFTGNIVDQDPSWYDDMTDDTDELTVLEMKVTAPEPNEYLCKPFDDLAAPKRGCTLLDIYNDTDANDDYEPVLHAQMQMDDFLVPDEFMNSVFKQKGKSTRGDEQKSYRIKLDSKTILYKNERTFQLNKHPYDDSRMKNKMAFDIFIDIPNITSLKTKFVQLYVNDVHYGLYTHIESVGLEYLVNRGLKKDENLYKAQEFGFFLNDKLALDEDGKPVDPEAFDTIIEVERGKDHTKLINMVDIVNKDLNEVEFEIFFNRYFNRENYITWMAINLVMANKDTVSQNFYLLNPLGSDTFYFLPWDYDGAGRETVKYSRWELGIGNWWGIPLHRKFLRVKKNRDDLYAMADKLRAVYITPKIIQEKIDVYQPLIKDILLQTPDTMSLREDKWMAEVNMIIPRLEENIYNYKSQIGYPMPFWQGYEYEHGLLSLNWEESVDFENDEIVYDLIFADNVDFNNTRMNEDGNESICSDYSKHEDSIVNEVGLSVGQELEISEFGIIYYRKIIDLEPGRYFMKVTAREKNNPDNCQIAFNKEVSINGIRYFGTMEVIIE